MNNQMNEQMHKYIQKLQNAYIKNVKNQKMNT